MQDKINIMSKNKKGTVVLSIDDGRKDCYRLYKEVLQKYNLPATFNIVTDWIDKTIDNEGEIISREELKEISQSPLIEIAGHSHTHSNEYQDIVKGKRLLCEWIGLKGDIGFASPGSGMESDFVKENEKLLREMGFLYVRGALTKEKPTEKHLAMKSRAVTKGCDEYIVKFCKEISYEYTTMFVNSVVVCSDNTISQLKTLVEFAIEENACVVFMFHSVKKNGEQGCNSLWSYDYDSFIEFAKYLSNLQTMGQIEVVTTKQAYLKFRK